MAKVENNKIVWETSEFPILCETCLGQNPYVRMTKQPFGKECKICARPFTIFRWCPGTNMRYKKTEICQTCAKVKNVCQTCVLDLQYNLPVQVRDAGLGLTDNLPRSNVNKDYAVKNAEKQLESGKAVYDFEAADKAGKELLKKMARTEPFYKRNRPHICSFYIKGSCTRGDTCPYRHEVPVENDLAKQNIKDRYYGTNDPVARKILSRANNASSDPPEDKSITSLFLTGIQDHIYEADIRTHFSEFGPIKSVVVVYKANCAFVNFVERESAEAAVKKSFTVQIRGIPIVVSWGRPKQGPSSELEQKSIENSTSTMYSSIPPPPGSFSTSIQYPSQDPTMLGSTNRPK